MTASRLPLPMAYADPAFDACVAVAEFFLIEEGTND